MQQGPELDALIKHARAVVLPSECYENCSMAVLEAMSFARPVVGARIGGIPEQIRHGIEGLLFEPGNAQDLADALDEIAENPQQAREMGQKGRERLCQKYSLRKHMERCRRSTASCSTGDNMAKKSRCWVPAASRMS